MVWYSNSTANARAENGALIIQAQADSWQVCWDLCRDDCLAEGKAGQELQWCIDDCGWPRCNHMAATSARLRTKGTFSVAPGSSGYGTIRVSARIKLPAGDGLWPAFWMLPETDEDCSGCGAYGSWPLSGEIDIMEAVNAMDTVFGTIHYGKAWPENSYLSGTKAHSANEYHEFAVEWESKQMRWYLNGVQYHSAYSGNGTTSGWFSAGSSTSTKHAPFDRKFHLVLNLAVGGGFTGYPFSFDNRKAVWSALSKPKKMTVDWIRVEGIKR
jgi:beta-glucanase (GH16 family)